jgi:23S rRNA G2445 N2-methylase RlmL
LRFIHRIPKEAPRRTSAVGETSYTWLSVPAATSSLARVIADPGYTPRLRDVAALVDLLAEEEHARHAERAIARVGAAALDVLEARFAPASTPLRGRIVRAIGRLTKGPGEHRARALLLGALADADPKTRRNAAIALGHAPGEGVEGALLDAWQHDPRPEMRRSIAASLGKVGSAASLPLLREEALRTTDAEMARIAAQSVLILERTASRAGRGTLDATLAPPSPVPVVALTRRGIEGLLADELAAAPGVESVRVAGEGEVRASLVGPMRALFAARTMLSFRFPLPAEWVPDGGTPEDAVARATTGEAAQRVFETWTAGEVRYRIAWAEGGHRRARTWALARAIARRAPQLVNDPTGSLWEVVVGGGPRNVEVAIAPRALPDPRFSWRRSAVPAASHPTIAAALARVAGARGDDVVWDPFVGSGGEVVERALLGPYRSLLGTDIDERALAAARENIAAAGLTATIDRADALVHAPEHVTLIITNPPMGRRASRLKGLADALDRFVAHAAEVLKPGGRLVWIAPWPKRARAAGERAGMVLDWARTVDMGGFDAEIQRWTR